MKRMLFICAALLTASIASAVTSQNIVGYSIVPTIKADDYTMLGNNFEAVGIVDAAGVPINTLFAEQSDGTFTGGPSFAEADQLMVWDITEGYKNYFFGDWSDGEDYNRRWYSESDDSVETPDVIFPGSGVWFVRKGAAVNNFALAGQVSLADSYELNVKANDYTMFANPYPMPLPLNGGVDWTGATGGPSFAEADQIMVWDATEGYKNYFFGDWADGEDYNQLWYSESDDSVETPDSIPVGAAAWYVRSGITQAFTVTKPF